MHSEIAISDQTPNLSESIFLKENLPAVKELELAYANGVEDVCIFLEALEGKGIPRNHPKLIKNEIDSKITCKGKIKDVRFTRTNKILIETNDLKCAQEVASFTSFLNTPVRAYLQEENISTKFALHNIDSSVSLSQKSSRKIISKSNRSVASLRRGQQA